MNNKGYRVFIEEELTFRCQSDCDETMTEFYLRHGPFFELVVHFIMDCLQFFI